MALPAAEPRPGLEKCFVQKPEHSQDPWNEWMNAKLIAASCSAHVLLGRCALATSPSPQFSLHVDRGEQGRVRKEQSIGIPTQPPAAQSQQSNELQGQWPGAGDTGRVPWLWASTSPHCPAPGLTLLPFDRSHPLHWARPGTFPLCPWVEGAAIAHHCSHFQPFSSPAFLTFKSPIDSKAACPWLAGCDYTPSQEKKEGQEQQFCPKGCIISHFRVNSLHFGRSSSWKEGQMKQNRRGCCWKYLLETSHCHCTFSSLGFIFSPLQGFF